MKSWYKIFLIAICVLVVPYASITGVALGVDEILNPASILYFPGVVTQLVANEGNGIICVDACGPCSSYGTFYIEVNGTCVLPDEIPQQGVVTLERIPTFDYEIKTDGVTYGSQYQILGGTINEILYDKHSNSLILSLNESEEGYLQIVIQIGLLHSIDQSPFTYIVIIDGEEAIFEQLSPIILKIPFEKGTKQIEIVGTHEI